MVGNWGESADRPSPAEVLVVGHSFVRRAFQHAHSHREACAPLTHDAIVGIGMGGATLVQILDKAMEALSFHRAVRLIIIHGGENEIDQDRPGSPPVDYDQVYQAIQDSINALLGKLPHGCKVIFLDPANRFRWTTSEGKQGEGYDYYMERLSKLISIFHSVRNAHPDIVLKAKRLRDISNIKSFGPDGVHLNEAGIHYYCHHLIQHIRRLVTSVNFSLPAGH